MRRCLVKRKIIPFIYEGSIFNFPELELTHWIVSFPVNSLARFWNERRTGIQVEWPVYRFGDLNYVSLLPFTRIYQSTVCLMKAGFTRGDQKWLKVYHAFDSRVALVQCESLLWRPADKKNQCAGFYWSGHDLQNDQLIDWVHLLSQIRSFFECSGCVCVALNIVHVALSFV